MTATERPPRYLVTSPYLLCIVEGQGDRKQRVIASAVRCTYGWSVAHRRTERRQLAQWI